MPAVAIAIGPGISKPAESEPEENPNSLPIGQAVIGESNEIG